MKPVRLPEGWEEVCEGAAMQIDNIAWCRHSDWTIHYFEPAWAAPFDKWALRLMLNHERAHAWGIKQCANPFCLMFESNAWGRKEAWWEPWIMAVGIVFSFGGRFCRKHRRYLEAKGAFEAPA